MRPTSTDIAKNVTRFFVYLLVVWGFWRLLFQAPDPWEELLVKPLVWLLPLAYVLKREKQGLASIGVTTKGLFPTLYFTLMLGAVFLMIGFLTNYLKYSSFSFNAMIASTDFTTALILSFFTAVTEELVFRGYFFTRLETLVQSEWTANLLVSVGWVLIHMPIAIFDWKLMPMALLSYIAVIFVFSIGATFVFARTRNVFAASLLHVLWQWPVILYR